MTRTILNTLFFILIVSVSAAQGKDEYAAAERLAKEATTQLQQGEARLADSLIRLSINTYPTTAVFDYALATASLPDIAGANRIMDMARIKILAWKKDRFIMDIPFRGVMECDKHYAYFGFMLKAYEVNKAFGERKWIEYSLTEAGKVSFRPMMMGGSDYYTAMQQVLQVDLMVLQKRYYEAILFIQNPPPFSIYTSPELKAQSMIPILCEMGDFRTAVMQVQILGVNPAMKNAVHSWLFYINAQTGNRTSALEHFQQLPSDFVQTNLNANYYVLGLLDIAAGNYEQAVHRLLFSISRRGNKGLEAYMLVEKWKVCKALGDAYAGLKQYEKAKDNYSIALLAYPDYEPAVAALKKLDADQAKASAEDKTGPVISLLEPSPQRGLIVSSTQDTVMVKGFASDISGIRSISINGKEIYSQPAGDFWGEVAMKTGINKITVTATDGAGNKQEQVFEVERKAEAGKENVTEGRNFALLLAAQQYTDDNIPSLENPVADAIKLKLVLRNNYNFPDSTLITLFNPRVDDIKRQLLELGNIIRPEDNLVIFYAGHGIWMDKEKKGYWLLTDSKRYDEKTWLPNRDVLDLIAKLPSRHTLLITDACFSGSVFKTRGLQDIPASVKQLNDKITRVAITSGNDTEVPDKSVFMKYLVRALSENKESYLTAQKMFVSQIIEAVMTETKTEPRYGTLELAGHVGGDYIFTRK